MYECMRKKHQKHENWTKLTTFYLFILINTSILLYETITKAFTEKKYLVVDNCEG